MLLRIDSVQEIGRFAKLTQKAQQFAKLSLIFARNGYGKSTFSAILRSLSEGDVNLIHARRRLSATADCTVQMSWAPGTTVAFSGGMWNSCPGKIHVFDQDYILRNLHVGESVTRDNKRSLLPVVLGEEGVRLSNEIRRLDQEQRDIEASSKAHARTISAACPIVRADQLIGFCTKDIPSDLADRIDGAAKRVQLARQATTVVSKRALRVVPILPIDHFRQVLGRTVVSVSEDAEFRVRAHLAKCQMEQNGDRWVKFGLDHMEDSTCPFCGQFTGTSDLVGAYQTYFSEAFAELSAERDRALAGLDALLNDEMFAELVQQNSADVEFWSQVCELPSNPYLSADQLHKVVSGLGDLRGLLIKKASTPLERISLENQETDLMSCFAEIEAYNTSIIACNAVIDAAKKAVGTVNLANEEEALAKWKALAERLREPVKSAADLYAQGEARRAVIAEEKKVAQAALTDYAKRTMDARQRQINELLSDFGASFEIVDAKANFKGREPNTDYAISVGGHKVEAGEKSDNVPSFKTVLSAGDKSTLALAFFVTQVRSDPKIADAIIVFDDPFSSQDMSRQVETAGQIRAIAELSCQTIVLSHDPRFLLQIEKDVGLLETRAFQLQCNDAGLGSLSAWSAQDELEPLYLRQFEMIRSYANQGVLLPNTNLSSVKQAMRPFLEDYLKLRFPGRFVNREQISAMAMAIKNAGPTDPLHASADALIALNEFTRTDMHGGADNPDPDQLRAQAKKLLRIVGSY